MIDIGGAIVKGENLEKGWNCFKGNNTPIPYVTEYNDFSGTIPEALDMSLPLRDPENSTKTITQIVYVSAAYQYPLGLLFCRLGAGNTREKAYLKLRKLVFSEGEDVPEELQNSWAVDSYSSEISETQD